MTLTISFLHHLDYRETHDTLHLALSSDCGDRCPVRDHLLLQAPCAAVKISEAAMGTNGDQPCT